MLSFFLICLMAPYFSPAPSSARVERVLIYDVYSDDKHIGEIQAVLRADGSTRFYEMKTKVEYRVLFKTMQFDNLIASQYHGEVLSEASSTDHLNEKLRSQNRVLRTREGYQVQEDDKKASTLTVPTIRHCLASIYFTEPKGISQVFSQRLAALIPIREVAPHKYAVELSSSKTNYYYFKNGICTEVEVNHWFDDFHFKLRQE